MLASEFASLAGAFAAAAGGSEFTAWGRSAFEVASPAVMRSVSVTDFLSSLAVCPARVRCAGLSPDTKCHRQLGNGDLRDSRLNDEPSVHE
jgi:hypothetical protein